MSKKLVVILGAFLLLGVIVTVSGLSVVNKEVELRNSITAQQTANTASFDKMWKVLQTKAGVVGQYRDDFQAIWPEIIKGRYASGDTLMKWVQERNPKFDSGLYQDLMTSVEAERAQFLRDQKLLISKHQEREDLLGKPVSGFFLRTFGNSDQVEITVVTSDETQEAFETGKEDSSATDLFNREGTKDDNTTQ